MIASVRTTAGLGYLPKVFTNSNESLNNLLKQKVDFKCSEWPRFHKTLRVITEEQHTEFEKAIFGQGEYELVDEFEYLKVPHSQWIQMSPDQRKIRIQKAYTATISGDNNSYLPSVKEIPSSSSKHLSINAYDAKVDHVSLDRAISMWEKAEELINTDGFVLPAVGAADTARQVASLTAQKSGKAKAPHHVYMQKHPVGVQVKCDCPVYSSSPNICQHALATADDLQILPDYLLWVRRTKKGANLSQLIASSVPKEGGKKPTTRRKSVQKNNKSKAPVELKSVPMSKWCRMVHL